MTRTRHISTVAFLLAALFLLAAPAVAQEHGVRKLEDYQEVAPYYEVPTLSTGFLLFTPQSEADVGIGRLYGYFGEWIRYDDNIYQADEDEESDVIFHTTLGLFAESFIDDHRLQLSYAPTYVRYADETDLDTWNHDANVDLRLDFVDAYVRIADRFTRTQEARDINFEGKVDRTKNRLWSEAGILVNDFGVGVRGHWLRRTYGSEIPGWQDLDEFGGGVFGRWTGLVDHALHAEYGILRRDYRGAVMNDCLSHTVLVGAEGRPHEDLSYFVKVGFVNLDADDDGGVGDDSDLTGFSMEAELRYDMQADIKGRLYYVRRPEYASFSNYQEVHRGGLDVTWAVDPGWLDVRGFAYAERADPSNEPDLDYLGAGLAAGAQLNDWSKIELGYEWRRRWGEGSADYTVNQVYLQAAIYF